jgi:hypothetical protein
VENAIFTYKGLPKSDTHSQGCTCGGEWPRCSIQDRIIEVLVFLECVVASSFYNTMFSPKIVIMHKIHMLTI